MSKEEKPVPLKDRAVWDDKEQIKIVKKGDGPVVWPPPKKEKK